MTDHDSETVAVDAFLLTRQWQESPSGNRLIFWFTSTRGPLRLVLEQQESVAFFPTAQESRLRNLLADLSNWRVGTTSLADFAGNPVSAIYFKSQRQLFAARDRLSNKQFHLLEADVKPTDRFLMERFLNSAARLQGRAKGAAGYLDIEQARLTPVQVRPNLKAVSLDIETDMTASQLYSIALYSDQHSIVLMRDEGEDELVAESDTDSLSLQFFESEKRLLEALVKTLESIDPDVVMGWNVVNFDLRCLQEFADAHKVALNLGRNNEAVNWRQSRDGNDRYYALVPGRVVLDGIDLMRSATYQFENFSLEYVSGELFDRGKLIDDVDQRGAEISELFHTDKAALARYNLEDCRLVWDIFTLEKLLDFAVERSLLTGLELDRSGGSVAAIDFLYLPYLHRQGFVAPALEQLESSNISPGGYVLESEPGIHRNVIVLDFKSLYPSIIRTFHVDPLALVEGLKENDAIPGFEGGQFSRTRTILPGLIKKLWAARDKAKADGNRVLSQAIKIIMNSFYGVLGTLGCRFFDTRLVSSITRRGHDIILQSKQFIEAAGFQVIYGDTDSVFVLMGDVGTKDEINKVNELGTRLAQDLNTWWREKLQREYQIESFLEMEFETHFLRFFMPTVRGSDAGSKKRYAGLLANGEIMFKGLETVRSDWSPLAREFQQVLYRKVFLNEPFVEYIKQIVADIQNGVFGPELVLRKRLRRKLSDYVKNVPPHVQAARKAEEIRKKLQLPALYEHGGWVEYVMTTAGPEPRQYRQSPVDYDFYIDKQLAPIADSILVFKQSSMDKILDRQIGLF
ncbi:MAG TPA: DNA polymerase II [Gammaproteobacteria bacterium]|nr:DNA polymerase II [Gammaproteobacteria bacterium]